MDKEDEKMIKHAGAYCLSFPKLAIAINVSKASDKYSELEREFYDESSEMYAMYHRSAIEYEISVQSLLYNAVKATSKESKTFDRAAYDELQRLRTEHKEEYERDKREYFSRE